VRSEISAAELQTIFSPFGNIAFSGYFGTPSAQPSGVITLSVLLTFASAASASEALARMDGFSLAGQTLEVASISDKEAARVKADIVAAEKKPKLHKVVLENMVSLEEVTDPTLKGEIAEEARRYGELRDVNIVIDHTKAVKVFLEYSHAAEAEKAFKTFDKRYFGGRCISAKLTE
jgi:NAD-dependent oxidoreductase involved in siderophore biosynthesis